MKCGLILLIKGKDYRKLALLETFIFPKPNNCLWHLGSHWGSLESQSLRNSFATLSRLIDVNDCFSSVLEFL